MRNLQPARPVCLAAAAVYLMAGKLAPALAFKKRPARLVGSHPQHFATESQMGADSRQPGRPDGPEPDGPTSDCHSGPECIANNIKVSKALDG